MELGSNIEMEPASADGEDCDILISDEREAGEPVIHRAWKATDDESVLVVEDDAPEKVLDFARKHRPEEVLSATEAQRTHVKYTVQGVREEVAYYLEEPPEDAYVDIGRLEAFEILERRGIEATNLDDAWYYPRRNTAAFLFVSSDDAGEVYRTLRKVKNLDGIEKGLVNGEWPDDEDESVKTIEELQEEVYQSTTWAEFESGIIACWRRRITDYEEIAAALDSNYQTVTSSVYHIRDKLEMRAREQRMVYPVVPEEFQSDDLLMHDD